MVQSELSDRPGMMLKPSCRGSSRPRMKGTLPMNQYNVTLQAVVNVRVPAVEASTAQEAVNAALDRIDLYSLFKKDRPTPKVEFSEYAEEVNEAVVDDMGDEEFERSQWFIWHDGQWIAAPANQQDELRLLDEKAHALRKELGFSDPGEVIWQANVDIDEVMVVVADGHGRASLLRASGNYPLDYLLKEQRDFDSEDAACIEADRRREELNL